MLRPFGVNTINVIYKVDPNSYRDEDFGEKKKIGLDQNYSSNMSTLHA